MRADFLKAMMANPKFVELQLKLKSIGLNIMEIMEEVDRVFSDRFMALDEEVGKYVNAWIDGKLAHMGEATRKQKHPHYRVAFPAGPITQELDYCPTTKKWKPVNPPSPIGYAKIVAWACETFPNQTANAEKLYGESVEEVAMIFNMLEYTPEHSELVGAAKAAFLCSFRARVVSALKPMHPQAEAMKRATEENSTAAKTFGVQQANPNRWDAPLNIGYCFDIGMPFGSVQFELNPNRTWGCRIFDSGSGPQQIINSVSGGRMEVTATRVKEIQNTLAQASKEACCYLETCSGSMEASKITMIFNNHIYKWWQHANAH